MVQRRSRPTQKRAIPSTKRPTRRVKLNNKRTALIRKGLLDILNPNSNVGLPDGGTFPSQHFCSTSRYTLTTDSSHGAAVSVIPLGGIKLSHFEADSFTDATTVLSYATGSRIPEYSSINASFSRYRVVGVHVSIQYP
jgi:hypothetical protein